MSSRGWVLAAFFIISIVLFASFLIFMTGFIIRDWVWYTEIGYLTQERIYKDIVKIVIGIFWLLSMVFALVWIIRKERKWEKGE